MQKTLENTVTPFENFKTKVNVYAVNGSAKTPLLSGLVIEHTNSFVRVWQNKEGHPMDAGEWIPYKSDKIEVRIVE